MEILEIKDREDGGADIKIDFTEEELELLLSYALSTLLDEKIKKSINK